MTAHRNTFWLDTPKTRIFPLRESSGPAPPKGVTCFKNRKKPKNYELLTSLANNFHLFKTKQGNLKEEKKIHTHIQNCTRHLLVMHLNSTTVDLFWLKGVRETQSMHIYIYTDIKGHEVIRCRKHMLFAFSHGYDLSVVHNGAPKDPTSTALSQAICSLASAFYL